MSPAFGHIFEDKNETKGQSPSVSKKLVQNIFLICAEAFLDKIKHVSSKEAIERYKAQN